MIFFGLVGKVKAFFYSYVVKWKKAFVLFFGLQLIQNQYKKIRVNPR